MLIRVLTADGRSALQARENAVALREAEAKRVESAARAVEDAGQAKALEAERLKERLTGLEKSLEAERADLAKRKVIVHGSPGLVRQRACCCLYMRLGVLCAIFFFFCDLSFRCVGVCEACAWIFCPNTRLVFVWGDRLREYERW